MARATPLQRILAPLTVDEFARSYFQRAPLRIRGLPGKFDFLFRDADFKLRLDRATEIRAVFPGQRQAQIHPADIKPMIEAGATICVTGMDKAHPRLSRAASTIRSELGYSGEVSFRAYLSPPGRGFDLHFDARVATTLQIAGTKRWWYSAAPAIPFPLYNSGREPRTMRVRYKVPRRDTLKSVLLRPGDVLCLPAGVWHCAEAGTTSLALNLAFDHYGAGVLDSLMHALQDRLMHEPRWREPLPAAPGQRGRLSPEVRCRLRDRIADLESELRRMREDDAALEQAWRLAASPHR